jgi:hypothetical protein
MKRNMLIPILFGTTLFAIAAPLNTDYITPSFTFSPDHRYGVMIPVFHLEAEEAKETDNRMNKVVDLSTKRVVTVIRSEPGYDRALNHHETVPPLWSLDSSILLWKVEGKWFCDALILLKIKDDKEQWQIDLMKESQRAILSRTRDASPERYAAARQNNVGNGSSYPEGFTVRVTTNEKQIVFPYQVEVDLTANPKEIEGFRTNLESHMNAIVTEEGKYIVTKFNLGRR